MDREKDDRVVKVRTCLMMKMTCDARLSIGSCRISHFLHCSLIYNDFYASQKLGRYMDCRVLQNLRLATMHSSVVMTEIMLR